MGTIVDTIADHARQRVAIAKEKLSAEKIKQAAYDQPKGDFGFEKALKKPGISFICECKKASPSKGIIAEDYPYLRIAGEYEAAGADAISVLTEPKWFLGSDDHLRQITQKVHIPVIRKDFTVDEYMIYEAKLLGAAAVLLIVSILPEDVIRNYINICDDLGLSALVETHDAEEIQTAISAKARIIGVNNRNLKDFSISLENTGRLRKYIPDDKVFIAESGIMNDEDVRYLDELYIPHPVTCNR